MRSGSPLQSLRERFEGASWKRFEGLLQRYGHRLTAAERISYAAQASASAGSGMELRRRLLDRLLRSAAQRRRPHRWEELESLETLPRGPYNDRAVLEETLRRASVSDPEWTRELLDLYARLGKLQAICQTLTPQVGKSTGKRDTKGFV